MYYRELSDAALFQLAAQFLSGRESSPRLSSWLGKPDLEQEHEFGSLLKTLLLEAFNESVPARLDIIIDQYAPFEHLHRLFGTLQHSFLREHLRHLVRDMLLALALREVLPHNRRPASEEIIIAALLHDIAYPVEHFRENLYSYTGWLGEHYLAGKFDLKVRLASPDTLADLLHLLGSRSELREYYQHVVFPAVAERSLFQTKHSFSGSVIYWSLFSEDLKSPHPEQRFDRNRRIAEAIALHDRSAMPWGQMDDLSTLLRLADELQEWARGGPIRMSVPQIEDEPGNGKLAIRYDISPGSGVDAQNPDPVFALTDKILGLWPLCSRLDTVKVSIRFIGPTATLTKEALIDRLVTQREKHARQMMQQVYFDKSGVVRGSARETPMSGSEQSVELRKMLTEEISVTGEDVSTSELYLILQVRGLAHGSPRVIIEQSDRREHDAT
jgi:hypothetical protein